MLIHKLVRYFVWDIPSAIMKLVLALLLLTIISCIHAQRFTPYSNLNNVPILRSNYDLNPDGSYQYDYQTGNGIAAQEQGYVKNFGNPASEAQVMQGSYTYTGPDGVTYTVTYIADENGYRASGAHLPTPPPIPDAIVKSLAYNAAHPGQGDDSGRYFK